MNRIIEFFKEIKEEFSKVEWTSRREVIVLTSLVFFISGIVSIYLGVFDVLFTNFLLRIGIL